MHHNYSALIFLVIIFIIIIVVAVVFSDSDDHHGNRYDRDSDNNVVNGFNGSLQSVTQFSTTLGGNSEVPPNESRAVGLANVSLFGNTRVQYEVQVVNAKCKLTGASFNNAPAGGTGAVVKTLPEPVCQNGIYTYSGEWTSEDTEQPLTPELVTALRAGELYLTVSSTKYPDGEVRGQVSEVLLT